MPGKFPVDLGHPIHDTYNRMRRADAYVQVMHSVTVWMVVVEMVVDMLVGVRVGVGCLHRHRFRGGIHHYLTDIGCCHSDWRHDGWRNFHFLQLKVKPNQKLAKFLRRHTN